jgi:hypothetical protein
MMAIFITIEVALREQNRESSFQQNCHIIDSHYDESIFIVGKFI